MGSPESLSQSSPARAGSSRQRTPDEGDKMKDDEILNPNSEGEAANNASAGAGLNTSEGTPPVVGPAAALQATPPPFNGAAAMDCDQLHNTTDAVDDNTTIILDEHMNNGTEQGDCPLPPPPNRSEDLAPPADNDAPPPTPPSLPPPHVLTPHYVSVLDSLLQSIEHNHTLSASASAPSSSSSWDAFPYPLGEGIKAKLLSLTSLYLSPLSDTLPEKVKDLSTNSNKVLLGTGENGELYQERVLRALAAHVGADFLVADAAKLGLGAGGFVLPPSPQASAMKQGKEKEKEKSTQPGADGGGGGTTNNNSNNTTHDMESALERTIRMYCSSPSSAAYQPPSICVPKALKRGLPAVGGINYQVTQEAALYASVHGRMDVNAGEKLPIFEIADKLPGLGQVPSSAISPPTSAEAAVHHPKIFERLLVSNKGLRHMPAEAERQKARLMAGAGAAGTTSLQVMVAQLTNDFQAHNADQYKHLVVLTLLRMDGMPIIEKILKKHGDDAKGEQKEKVEEGKVSLQDTMANFSKDSQTNRGKLLTLFDRAILAYLRYGPEALDFDGLSKEQQEGEIFIRPTPPPPSSSSVDPGEARVPFNTSGEYLLGSETMKWDNQSQLVKEVKQGVARVVANYHRDNELVKAVLEYNQVSMHWHHTFSVYLLSCMTAEQRARLRSNTACDNDDGADDDDDGKWACNGSSGGEKGGGREKEKTPLPYWQSREALSMLATLSHGERYNLLYALRMGKKNVKMTMEGKVAESLTGLKVGQDVVYRGRLSASSSSSAGTKVVIDLRNVIRSYAGTGKDASTTDKSSNKPRIPPIVINFADSGKGKAATGGGTTGKFTSFTTRQLAPSAAANSVRRQRQAAPPIGTPGEVVRISSNGRILVKVDKAAAFKGCLTDLPESNNKKRGGKIDPPTTKRKRDEKKRQTKLRKVGLGEEKKVDPCALLLTAIEEMEEEEEEEEEEGAVPMDQSQEDLVGVENDGSPDEKEEEEEHGDDPLAPLLAAADVVLGNGAEAKESQQPQSGKDDKMEVEEKEGVQTEKKEEEAPAVVTNSTTKKPACYFWCNADDLEALVSKHADPWVVSFHALFDFIKGVAKEGVGEGGGSAACIAPPPSFNPTPMIVFVPRFDSLITSGQLDHFREIDHLLRTELPSNCLFIAGFTRQGENGGRGSYTAPGGGGLPGSLSSSSSSGFMLAGLEALLGGAGRGRSKKGNAAMPPPHWSDLPYDDFFPFDDINGSFKLSSGMGGGGRDPSASEVVAAAAANRAKRESIKGRLLLSVFPTYINMPTPRKEEDLVKWDQMMVADVATKRREANNKAMKNALAMCGMVCPDLDDVISLDKSLLSPSEIEDILGMAVAAQLEEKKKEEERRGEGEKMDTIDDDDDGPANATDGTHQWTIPARFLSTAATSAAVFSKDIMPASYSSHLDKEDNKPSALKDIEGTLNRYECMLVEDIIPPSEIPVGFEDVGSLNTAKTTLEEVVCLPLRRPELFNRGALRRPTKGLLLFGPPGTGKTMLAKALAKESGAHFLSINMSSIDSKYYGESEKMVKAVFTLAHKLSPCIIFIDEIDAALSQRSSDRTESEHNRKVKNEFMSHWDGLRTNNSERVLVLGATNRPMDLDEAVIRRMPRRLMVPLPDTPSREQILRTLLADEELEDGFDFSGVAAATDQYSGSDLKNLAIAAAHFPIREFIQAEKKIKEKSNAADDKVGKEKMEEKSDGDVSLRPVTTADFLAAMKQVTASTDMKGANMEELQKWNEQFGEGGSGRVDQKLSYYM